MYNVNRAHYCISRHSNYNVSPEYVIFWHIYSCSIMSWVMNAMACSNETASWITLPTKEGFFSITAQFPVYNKPICALGAMTNANKLPSAKYTLARVSTSSVLYADNTLTVHPMCQWIIAFTIHVYHRDWIKTQEPSPQIFKTLPLCEEARGGIRYSTVVSCLQSHFTLCLPLSNTAFREVLSFQISLERWTARKIMW